MNTFESIYNVVKQIPLGKVATYGLVAKLCKIKTNAKVVGYALHANKTPIVIPCHRVVNKKGELAKGFAFGGCEIQAELLKQEGVKVENNKVDLTQYLWEID